MGLSDILWLIGGFNPHEKYESDWIIIPTIGESENCSKGSKSSTGWENPRIILNPPDIISLPTTAITEGIPHIKHIQISHGWLFIPITLWLFNIAMENGPFVDDFPTKTSIYKGFSMAMLNNQMVHSKFLQVNLINSQLMDGIWRLNNKKH